MLVNVFPSAVQIWPNADVTIARRPLIMYDIALFSTASKKKLLEVMGKLFIAVKRHREAGFGPRHQE